MSPPVSSIPRHLKAVAMRHMQGFPAIAITGPRQSGKTTLAREIGGDRLYASLENPDVRRFAEEDPRGFLAQFPDGAVLDEIQRCPPLFSYLQGILDADRRMGRFILTGSQQFGMIESITQSLAGRVSLLSLWPFSLSELEEVGRAPASLDDLLHAGLFPPIHDRPVDPDAWLQSYVATYLERDVRMSIKVQDLATFQRFLQLCAGRVGQLVNLSSLASDTGISRATAEAWLSVLQAGFIVFLARPYFTNTSKRLIKTPKIYFTDPGLAAWLIGIRSAGHVRNHPLRGAIFENWVMTELAKAAAHAGHVPAIGFLRDKEGHEIDAIVENGNVLHAIEAKSGQTVPTDAFKGLDFWRPKLPPGMTSRAWLIHGGDSTQSRQNVTVLPWHGLAKLLREI
ncbi:MAG: ATP-binding protein [Luteolibacter sp.]